MSINRKKKSHKIKIFAFLGNSAAAGVVLSAMVVMIIL